MIALFGVLSMLGLGACIILTVLNIIRKKSNRISAIGILISFVALIICFMLTPSVEDNKQIEHDKVAESEKTTEPSEKFTSEPNDKVTANTDKSELAKSKVDSSQETTMNEELDEVKQPSQNEQSVVTVEYDKLQSIFLALNFESSEDSLLKLIEENGLEYTSQKYNGYPKNITYTIAYEKDVALQRYADSGDYVEVAFSQQDGSLMYVEYFNDKAFMTAILYNYGTYWKFEEKEANNNYSGYYYYKPGDEKGGITMMYSNGNSTETGYHSVSTGEEALAGVLN